MKPKELSCWSSNYDAYDFAHCSIREFGCVLSVISQRQPLQGVWISASGYDTDAFNKEMQPPSGKSPCLTKAFKRY